MVDWIRASIRSLAAHPDYGTLEAVYLQLTKLSGISKSAIMKLHSGESMNPKAETIDRLVAAIKLAALHPGSGFCWLVAKSQRVGYQLVHVLARLRG